MSLDEEDSPPSTPAWMLTFGDMMGLLLTFFILLVSMSEIREDDRFQGVTDSIQERFGYEAGLTKIPGESHPRHPLLASLVMSGREWRTKSDAAKEHGRAFVMQGNLSDARREEIRHWVKKQHTTWTIEICGRAAEDRVEGAFQQAREVRQFLIDDVKLAADRLQISIVTAAEDRLEIRAVQESARGDE